MMNRNDRLKLDIKTSGVYIGEKTCDLLWIVSLNSKEEIREFIEHKANSPIYSSIFVNKTIDEVIPAFNEMELEECKKSLFKAYQNYLLDFIDAQKMSEIEKLNQRLIDAKIELDDIKDIDVFLLKGDPSGAENYLKQIGGDNFLKEILNMDLVEWEGEKSITYEEAIRLNAEITNNPAINTIVGSGGHYRNTHKFDGTSYYFDRYQIDKEIEYCKKAGCKYRYHALIDYKSALEMKEKNIPKEEVLIKLKKSIEDSFNYISNVNKDYPANDKLINTVEIFNELIEYNKEDGKDYQMIWEKEFGITNEDLVHLFDGIKKPEGVSFMYNETMLEESEERNKVVEDTYKKMQVYSNEQNGKRLIDIFGNQMHLESAHGLSGFEEGSKKENLRSGLGLMKRIQEGYPDEEILPIKTEITEFDIHTYPLSMAKAMQMLKNAKTQEEVDDIYSLLSGSKQQWIYNVSELIKSEGLKINNVTYWSLLDNGDHNLRRANEETSAFGFRLPTLLGGLYGDFGETLSIKEFADLIDSDSLNNYITAKEKSLGIVEETSIETVSQTVEEPTQTEPIVAEEGPVKTIAPKKKKTHGNVDPMSLATIILTALTVILFTIYFKLF